MADRWRDEVRALMDAHKINQTQLAEAVEVSPQYICDVLNGRRDPTPKLTDAICEKYHLPTRVKSDLHRAGAMLAGWEWI